MYKKFYIQLVSFFITRIHLPTNVRDFFIWPLATRILGRDYSDILKLKAGFSMHAYMDDHLGRLAIFYGSHYPYFWEPETTQLVEKLVSQAEHVIVAGSHVGLTALYTRNALPQTNTSCVHTFEPIPYLYEISHKNFSINTALGQVQLQKAALGDITGSVTMTNDRIRSRIITDTSTAQGVSTENVPVVTIDAYCDEHNIQQIDFVLLDVEGYEYNALSGMKKLLETRPPKDIIYEISFPKNDNLGAASHIETYLKQFGYSFYIIEDTSDPLEMTNGCVPSGAILTPATEATYASHLNHRYFNMYATQRNIAEIKTIARVLEG